MVFVLMLRICSVLGHVDSTSEHECSERPVNRINNA